MTPMTQMLGSKLFSRRSPHLRFSADSFFWFCNPHQT